MRIRLFAPSAAIAPWLVIAAAWNLIGSQAAANPPWQIFAIKKVEADPNKAYPATDANGPWMIMATTFRGDHAEVQAKQLVFELRKNYKLNAYTHKQFYDYTKRGMEGIGLDKYGKRKSMQYGNEEKVEAVAVLVGDYRGIDDPDGQKNLVMLKQAQPECLKTPESKTTGNSFAELRRMSQQMFTGGTTKGGGPLSSAFMTTNPLLPKEYFAPKAGIDKFVVELNKGNDYSLLDCKGHYSVKIATFTGKVVIDQRKIHEIERGKGILPVAADDSDPLVYAAKKAHALTEELRKKGVEAYEFHDRYSSIVTVGSFSTVGTPRQDGKTEINPRIYEIMRTYGPDPNAMLAGGATDGLGQKSVMLTIDKEKKTVLLDVQPIPIEVPRRSISSDYQQTSFFR